MTISNIKRGFTLVELLVVVAVFGSIMAIVIGVVTSTLRGANKSRTISKVRENGNYAIFQISRTIKYAKTIDGASMDGNPPWDCQLMPSPLAPTPTPIHYKAVKATSFDGTATTFSCNDTGDFPPETIAVNFSESLIDASSVIMPAPIPSFCFFTCVRERIIDPPSIGINFTLTSKSPSSLVETQASIPFTTKIKGRN